MDIRNIRMQTDRIQTDADKSQQLSVQGVKRQEDSEQLLSENSMLRSVEQNQEKNPDFLAERQTEDSREELRIKSKALQENDRMQQRVAGAEYERSQGLERSNLLNQRAADVQKERQRLEELGEDEVSEEQRETMRTALDRSSAQLDEERRGADRVNLANTQRAREMRLDQLAQPGAVRTAKEQEAQTKEEASVQEAARGRESMQVSGQQRIQEEVTRMLDNMRIASDDAKGIQYSSTI